MKPKTPSILDFRMAITEEIDLVLSARARAFGLDKAAIARDVLARWAAQEVAFGHSLKEEEARVGERAERVIRRRPLTRVMQNRVFRRDGFKCRNCGTEPGVEQLHIDHILPVSAGGSDDYANLQVLCAPCNLAKSNKIVPIAGQRP